MMKSESEGHWVAEEALSESFLLSAKNLEISFAASGIQGASEIKSLQALRGLTGH